MHPRVPGAGGPEGRVADAFERSGDSLPGGMPTKRGHATVERMRTRSHSALSSDIRPSDRRGRPRGLGAERFSIKMQ